MMPVAKSNSESKEKPQDFLNILNILQKNNKIRKKSEQNFMPFIIPLNRDAKIEDMEDIIHTICIKVKDTNFEGRAVLRAFEESIKRLKFRIHL